MCGISLVSDLFPQVTPILYALRVAFPAVALCICRQLEIVSSTLDVSYDPRDKYFTSVFHYSVCLVIPVVYAILRERHNVPVRRILRTDPFFRFYRPRSQIRSRAGIWVSSGHLFIGPSFVFNLVYTAYPLHDHRLLRRSLVLQLPPSLLILQPTPQPSIQDDHLDVLPFPWILSLRRPSHCVCGHLRYGLFDRRIWTLGVYFLACSSPGRFNFGYLQGEQVEIRCRHTAPHGSGLVDGPDRRLRSRRGFRFHRGMLDCRTTLLHHSEGATPRPVYPKAKV